MKLLSVRRVLRSTLVIAGVVFMWSVGPRLAHALTPEERVAQLQAGAFDAVEAEYAGLHKRHERTSEGASALAAAYEAFPVKKETLALLDAWCVQRPDSSIALTQRGIFYVAYAWEVRGHGFASTVTAQDWETFYDRINAAKADLERATQLDSANYMAWVYLMNVARAAPMGEGLTLFSLSRGAEEERLDMMEKAFAHAVAADPEGDGAYLQKLEFLKPKWYGSWPKLFVFTRQAAAAAPPHSRIPLVLVGAHEEAFYYGAGRDPAYFRDQKNWDEVEGVMQRLLADFPSANRLRARYALLAMAAGKQDLALQQFQTIQNMEEVMDSSYSNETLHAYRKLNMLEKLLPQVQQWVEKHPENPTATWTLGVLYAELNQPDLAQQWQRQTVALWEAKVQHDPDNRGARLQLLAAYGHTDPDLAIPQLTRYIESLAPKDPYGYSALAEVYIWKKADYAKAKPVVEAGLAIDPRNDRLWYELATARYYLGDRKGSLAAYRQSLLWFPDNAQVHVSIGHILYDDGKRDEAIAEYQQAIAIDPTFAMAYYDLAAASYDLGRFEQSRQAFQRFVELNPSDYPDLVATARRTLEGLKQRH